MQLFAYEVLVVAYVMACYQHPSPSYMLCVLAYMVIVWSHKKSADDQEGKKN